jgi:hypothetical protein
MLYKCSLSPWASTMELRTNIWFTSARRRTKHQTWNCEQNWMLYKCWLSQQPTGCIQVLAVATRCLTSAHCRHEHQWWSCEQLHALQERTVAISLHPGSGVSAFRWVAKSRTCEQLNVLQVRCRHKHKSRICETLDALQVLNVVTSINHGTAN